MAELIILEFDGVTVEHYRAVNQALGIDPDDGGSDWPDGIKSHAAGFTADGRLVVTEVWETQGHQEDFMHGRLGEALAKGGITGPPSSVTWIDLVTDTRIG